MKQQIIDMYNSGMSCAKISKHLQKDPHYISKVLKENGIFVENRQNKSKFDQSIFDKIDTEEKAYWLGFLFADGYISSHPVNKKPIYNIEISLKLSDLPHLQKMEKFFKFTIPKIKCDSYRCRLILTNKHLWTVLNNYGCTPKKSLTLKFPNLDIFNNQLLIYHFIRGYFDGDGCIYNGGKFRNNPHFCLLGTNEFLLKIQDFLFNTKFSQNHKSEKTLVLRYSGSKSLACLYLLYGQASIYLDRKYQLYLKYKNCRFKEKSLKLLQSKNGEGWDANTVLT